ncbi:hypothetical protein BD770DRAFT_432319 [Pilaira anomala]|nr:hypothetical protein BD770DRAFT_432319 [Pilaira anomala]
MRKICEKVKARYLEQFKSYFKENIVTDSAAKATASDTLIDACAARPPQLQYTLLDIPCIFQVFYNSYSGIIRPGDSETFALVKGSCLLLSLHFSNFDLQFHRTRSDRNWVSV